MFRQTFILVLLGALLVVVPVGVALLLLPSKDRGALVLGRADFEALSGWADDDHTAALETFKNACQVLMRQKPAAVVKPRRVGGRVSDWLSVCVRAATTEATKGSESAREFFEDAFTPLAILARGSDIGKFTGYFEPIIEGSRDPDPAYPVPAYRRPDELVTVDLGLFRNDLGGRRIAGRVSGGRLQPFESRSEIEAGALAGRGLEIMWLKDPTDLFFLQIQGSGRVRLADGSLIGLGYDGPNGHPYVAIGRLLIERGEIAAEDMSMQAIRRWIVENPAKGVALMKENSSYIFFRFLKRGGAEGALGTVLTPGRSLAVDRSRLPLGAPYWLEASHPDPVDPAVAEKDISLARLMVAEDVGGAIKGAIRGDVFWGHGNEAEAIAGAMNNEGRYYLLLPNALAARVLGEDKEESENGTTLKAP